MLVKEFISDNENEIRIDVFLNNHIEELSRTYIQKLIKDGYASVNGKPIKNNFKLKPLDKVKLNIPETSEPDIIGEDIQLDIVYEDDDVILINKPKNMVVHPAPGHYSGTLVNALMNYCKNLSGINGVLRPGIVHRIDMDTTGIIIACKNDLAHKFISEQLKVHSIKRKYKAVVHGNLKEDEGVIDKPIGRHDIDRKKMSVNAKHSKQAITHYKVIERFKSATLIECELETGRTHQIRVHMASINHPLYGDSVYGYDKEKYQLDGQVLHAETLGFVHPTTKEYMEFNVEIPEYFKELLRKLRLET
jgi:pseudouridine synthase, rluA family